MEIKNGWLDASDKPIIKAYPSARFYNLISPKPLGVVWHYSCPVWMGFKTAEQVSQCITKNINGASWHLMIDKSGSLFQSVSFNKGSWHVGKPGRIAGQDFVNINRATIGIELENAGRLKLINGKYYTWPYFLEHEKEPDPKLIISPDRVQHYKDNLFFDSFTNEQIESTKELVLALSKTYSISKNNFCYGHIDFDPDNREDPGPLWKFIHLPKIIECLNE
jgi:N-acetylmuramoyl-L-alanine amidase